MPADDYLSVGGGALRLKGGKVQKTKKKKKSNAPDLNRSLPAWDDSARQDVETPQQSDHRKDENDGDRDEAEYKTEAERQYEEANRKKMLKVVQDPKLTSEFRKTHKERVEGLNTYLSKLSEHHDMPKIGPG
ncbi:DUF1754-domain-containing protein [Durotheca rogersii]|uniref:DUF1754-domain-containing protein n=1 Tax=Durotheca rogersii TaxID=419775 RepID=UPI00222086B5|nr:DUF1754-domain-containing protein [Durotheca rogersii]KAI5856220.1 DUF1754-domain-containing protein [Durotheca rogersii]